MRKYRTVYPDTDEKRPFKEYTDFDVYKAKVIEAFSKAYKFVVANIVNILLYGMLVYSTVTTLVTLKHFSGPLDSDQVRYYFNVGLCLIAMVVFNLFRMYKAIVANSYMTIRLRQAIDKNTLQILNDAKHREGHDKVVVSLTKELSKNNTELKKNSQDLSELTEVLKDVTKP